MFRPMKKKRRLSMRRKRALDPSTVIDYKKPDLLRRFITDRGKIIPRRISGATAKQQRLICQAIKRARFLSLIPCSSAHLQERGFLGEIAAVLASAAAGGYAPRQRFEPGRPADTDLSKVEKIEASGENDEANDNAEDEDDEE